MSAKRFWISVLLACVFLVGLVFQTTRYAALRAEGEKVEQSEIERVKEGTQLDIDIAKLTNFERIEKAALRTGMQVAPPERRIIITGVKESDSQ